MSFTTKLATLKGINAWLHSLCFMGNKESASAISKINAKVLYLSTIAPELTHCSTRLL